MENILEVLLSQERVLTLLYDRTFPPRSSSQNIAVGGARGLLGAPAIRTTEAAPPARSPGAAADREGAALAAGNTPTEQSGRSEKAWTCRADPSGVDAWPTPSQLPAIPQPIPSQLPNKRKQSNQSCKKSNWRAFWRANGELFLNTWHRSYFEI